MLDKIISYLPFFIHLVFIIFDVIFNLLNGRRLKRICSSCLTPVYSDEEHSCNNDEHLQQITDDAKMFVELLNKYLNSEL